MNGDPKLGKRKRADNANGDKKLKVSGFAAEKAKELVNKTWEASVIRTLQEYIKIPSASPLYDKNWETNTYQEQAVDLLVKWVKTQNVKGLTCEVVKEKGRTPLIYLEIAPCDELRDSTVLMYGHFDKQPPLDGLWEEGLGPRKPIIRGNKLYGRGGADDGYSIFSAVTAVKVLQDQGLTYPRYVIVIEGCEESGSIDLPYYIDILKDKIGTPSLIICLDSGCGNYEQLWMTTSLRGLIAGDLRVEILKEGVHSGLASGIVPSSFRIMREILNRVESSTTGQVLIKECFEQKIPQERLDQAVIAADNLKETVYTEFPFVEGAQPISKNFKELLINRTWKPTISYTGIDGIPALDIAGNVLRTHTTLKLSVRLPPTVDAKSAAAAMKKALEKESPYGAKVTFSVGKCSNGWHAPKTADWLLKAAEESSQIFYNKPSCYYGEGGSIPFMGMLSDKFPQAQFMITGVLGPNSNAHGPNEFLHIPMSKKVTLCVANVLYKHAQFTKSSRN